MNLTNQFGSEQKLHACYKLEFAIRFVTVIVSILQFSLLNSEDLEECVYSNELLLPESQWVMMLINIQVAKVVGLTFAEIFVRNQQYAAEDSQESVDSSHDVISPVSPDVEVDFGFERQASLRRKEIKARSSGRHLKIDVSKRRNDSDESIHSNHSRVSG